MKATNYQGFTLLETLYGLVVLAMVLSFFQPLIKHLSTYQSQALNKEMIEWQVFNSQIEREISDGQLINVTPTSIKYKDSLDEYYIIEYYKDMIRKTTSSSGGHQPLLLHVESWDIQPIQNQRLYIEVHFSDGKVRSSYQALSATKENEKDEK